MPWAKLPAYLGQPNAKEIDMNLSKTAFALGALLASVLPASLPAGAQQQQKPNILFIMGDDIGIMQPSI